MLYKDIYSREFLEKFGKYKDEISKLSLDDNLCKIDVEAIAKKCEVSLDYGYIKSSEFTIDNEINSKCSKKVISINRFEPDYKQRFSIAYELGYIILGYRRNLYRHDKYKNTIERMHKVLANKFAAELIMPEKLVKKILLDSITELGYSIEQNFDDNDISCLIDVSASKMGVSTQAFTCKIKNLRFFVDENQQ